MRAVPLDQRRRASGTVVVDEAPMQMQTLILEAMDVNGGDLQLHIRALEDTIEVRGVRQTAGRLHPGERLRLIIETDHRRAARQDDGKPPGPVFPRQLLLVEDARGEFRALAEAQQADPVARALVAGHAPLDRVLELVGTRARVDFRVRLQPPEPPPEGAPVRVHRVHADALVAEKRRVHKHEAEPVLELLVVQERPELRFEDG